MMLAPSKASTRIQRLPPNVGWSMSWPSTFACWKCPNVWFKEFETLHAPAVLGPSYICARSAGLSCASCPFAPALSTEFADGNKVEPKEDRDKECREQRQWVIVDDVGRILGQQMCKAFGCHDPKGYGKDEVQYPYDVRPHQQFLCVRRPAGQGCTGLPSGDPGPDVTQPRRQCEFRWNAAAEPPDQENSAHDAGNLKGGDGGKGRGHGDASPQRCEPREPPDNHRAAKQESQDNRRVLKGRRYVQHVGFRGRHHDGKPQPEQERRHRDRNPCLPCREVGPACPDHQDRDRNKRQCDSKGAHIENKKVCHVISLRLWGMNSKV
ncbi:hypothetical protein RD1_2495 [Roseobacter denitrificans OCh 114]|uniref:Uncharacterized protein n=1 Tax=Roseobacter denitrificans (strain ATCC 33942 / OCh 114) TaxID=375451 RepID=Q166N8_ROSDO|nr:hypothetical protein RD1_2495 [Roseobacter denitrificans OCh 114]